MGKFLTILLLVTLLTGTIFAEHPKSPKLVILHHRHGARNTLHSFNIKANEEGQLTSVGLRQMYLLGREFRKRYIDELKMLPSSYNAKQVYARSTQFNRTLLSAQAFWAGFYPKKNGPKFDSDYPQTRAVPPFGGEYDTKDLELWALPKGIQPVPIHSCDNHKDWVLQAYDAEACPNRGKLLATPEREKIEKELTEAFMPTFKQVAEKMKMKAGTNLTLRLMSAVADYLYSNYMLGVETEIEPNSTLWQQFFMTKNISILLAYYPTQREMNIFTTKLYEDMLYRMNATLNNASRNKFIEFSSHDLTLNLILTSLGITSWQCLYENFKKNKFDYDPACPFATVVASSLVFEIWENDDNNGHYVKFYYNGVSYPINKKDPIPYDEFTEILKKSLVPDFFDQCLGVNEVTETIFEPMPAWHVVVVAIQVLAVIVLSAVLIKKRMEVPSSEKTGLSY